MAERRSTPPPVSTTSAAISKRTVERSSPATLGELGRRLGRSRRPVPGDDDNLTHDDSVSQDADCSTVDAPDH